MVRYMLSLNWTSSIGSMILTAFEAYGSALVGITPHELAADRLHNGSGVKIQTAHRE